MDLVGILCFRETERGRWETGVGERDKTSDLEKKKSSLSPPLLAGVRPVPPCQALVRVLGDYGVEAALRSVSLKSGVRAMFAGQSDSSWAECFTEGQAPCRGLSGWTIAPFSASKTLGLGGRA